MKICVLLSALLALGCVHVHGAPLTSGSCDDPAAAMAAKLAVEEINKDRMEGYKFQLFRLSNVNTQTHGENGVVSYLTMDVVETNCSVLIRDDSRSCVAREVSDTPVYGQCKAAIYISRVHRVVRLYKYDCAIRPVPASKVNAECPDCPSPVDKDNERVKETVSLALDKFNKEGGLSKRFALLRVERASSGMAMNMYYNVEFVIQETTCAKDAAATDSCPMMECEFTHKGFCTAALFEQMDDNKDVTVNCEVFEPEAAEKEKKLHLLGGETDHSHNDTHAHDPAHDTPHAADQSHTHDHDHDHTKGHAHPHQHKDSDHHHTHDHDGSSAHRHAHDHSHDHGHGHDHVHAHHAKAHDHSGDSPNHHHDYKHAAGVHTHEHDHELALDHDHKHAHLHDHEHHHHHHDHAHHGDHHHDHDGGDKAHDHHAHDHDHHHPEGEVRVLPSMDRPMTLPAFPDVPAAGPEVGVALPLKPDPQIPGMTEPTIEPFPTTLGARCPAPAPEVSLVSKVFAEDPVFKAAA